MIWGKTSEILLLRQDWNLTRALPVAGVSLNIPTPVHHSLFCQGFLFPCGDIRRELEPQCSFPHSWDGILTRTHLHSCLKLWIVANLCLRVVSSSRGVREVARENPSLTCYSSTRHSLFVRVHSLPGRCYLSSDSSLAFPLMHQGQGVATTLGIPAVSSTSASLTLQYAAGQWRDVSAAKELVKVGAGWEYCKTWIGGMWMMCMLFCNSLVRIKHYC